VPERFNLYRAQALRALGGNTFRTSHNPYSPELYPLLDQLGVLVWDEARDYTWSAVQDMASLVRRDRNRPSVLLWSFCNEVECEQLPADNTTQFAFRDAVTTHDPTRPTSYNAIPNLSTTVIDLAADVHGFSHVHPSDFAAYHEQHPNKPIVSSECCSCQTQRGEDTVDPPSVLFSNFDGECLREQVAWSDNLTYVAGTLGVWTLMDYYGEPNSWPHVSSSFGQFDLTGYPKAHAWWYRAWWLCDVATTDYGRPPFDACWTVHVVEQWDDDDAAPVSPKTVHVFSNAPLVELVLNNQSLGTQEMARHGYVTFSNVTYTPGILVAVARSQQGGSALATHTRTSPRGPRAGLLLSLAIPSPDTGTGTAVIADGHDAALVRVAVVDARGVVVPHATDAITFHVVSGPGLIVGVGNGDPSCHEHNRVPTRSAYHGLASVMVRVTLDCTTPNRGLLREIDVGSNSSGIVVAASCPPSLEPIVVQATASGLSSSSPISIPVSSTLSPLLAAKASLSDTGFDLLSGHSV
jgi:hypothetical protein